MKIVMQNLFRFRYHLYIIWFCLLFPVLFSCSIDKNKAPDVSDIAPQLKILRFENDFAALEMDNFESDLQSLNEKYPSFYNVYFQQIIADRPLKEEEIHAYAKEIISEKYLDDLLDSIDAKYPTLDPIINQLEQAMSYYRYYFKDTTEKVLVTFCSEFGVGSCTIGDDTLGLGLDMYLGSEYSGYDPNVFPAFVKASMSEEYIPTHLMKAMVQNKIPFMMEYKMLDFMMYQGKVLYVVSHLLPHTPDSILMEYTAEQMSWVETNELQIWSHFLSKELLHSTRKQDFQKLVGPSPNAPGMPPEAPGQTANWIAWQIVKSYMKRNPATTMDELLQMNDPLEILEKSKYRPQ